MTWPVAHKAQLGVRFVYPIGYKNAYTFEPIPCFEGSAEFCDQDIDQELDNYYPNEIKSAQYTYSICFLLNIFSCSFLVLKATSSISNCSGEYSKDFVFNCWH